MNINDIVGIVVGVVTILLLWQQNVIFKKQNEIFAAQSGGRKKQIGASASPSLTRYWPMLTMGGLTVVTWSAVALLLLKTPNVNRWPPATMEIVYARSFLNETVEIDGKKFDRCTFQNVKLLYHGTAPSEFNDSKFLGGPVLLGSDNVGTEFSTSHDELRQANAERWMGHVRQEWERHEGVHSPKVDRSVGPGAPSFAFLAKGGIPRLPISWVRSSPQRLKPRRLAIPIRHDWKSCPSRV